MSSEAFEIDSPLVCASSVKCRPVSKEKEEEIELVRTLVLVERREVKNIVMPALLLESGLLQGSKCVGFAMLSSFCVCICMRC